MKKMTILLAALCSLSCLTGCAGTEGTATQTTAQTTAQTTTAVTGTAAQTTTAATAAQTTAAATGTENAADTTGTASGTKTTSGTTGTTATTDPGDAMLTLTLEGHIAVLIGDVITEYGEKACEGDGYVVCSGYQRDPQVIRLPLEMCQKLSKDKIYTFVFPKTEVTDSMREFYFYLDKGSVYADYSQLLSKYGRQAEIREAQNDEYGLDCDQTLCVGMTPDKMPQNVSGSAAKKTGSFTAEVIRAFSYESFMAGNLPCDYVLLLRDGEPEILKAKKDLSKNLKEGSEYRFSFNKEGYLVK